MIITLQRKTKLKKFKTNTQQDEYEAFPGIPNYEPAPIQVQGLMLNALKIIIFSTPPPQKKENPSSRNGKKG